MRQHACLFALLFAFLLMQQPAAAQQIKPLEIEPDENGVDLLTGRVAHRVPPLAVPGAGNLRFTKVQDLLPMMIGTVPPGNEQSFQVNHGGSTSESLDCIDFECNSTKQNGSTAAGGINPGPAPIFTYYQGGTGKQVYFDKVSSFTNLSGGGSRFVLYPSWVKWANGEKHSYTYDTYTVGATTQHRPNKIVSNLGYEMRFTYQSNTGSNAGWRKVASVGIYKGSTLVAQYTYSGNTVTDLLNRSWTCGGCQFQMDEPPLVNATALTRPTESTPSYEATASSAGTTFAKPVGQVDRDGTSWNYSYTDLTHAYQDIFTPKFSKITVTGPNSFTRSADIWHPAPGGTASPRVTKITNGLGQSTQYDHDFYGRLLKITQPEGNAVAVTYDGLGNITEKRSSAKPGSGLSDIVETAFYASSTASWPCYGIMCFRPDYTRDAKGNQTDYTWDTGHGGLLTSLAPADANGVRTKTINEYTQSANGVYRLTKTRTCSENASGGNLTCGTADEVVKQITYWNDTLLSLTETATGGTGSISAVTTYSYNDAGRVLSVDGPLPGSGDTVHYRYDILGRKTWEIAPKNAGSNGKYIATRTTYRDADDQVLKVEKGTLTSPTDTNLVVLDTVEHTYNTRRLQTKTVVKGDDNAIQSVTQASYDARNMPLCSAVRMNMLLFANPPADACTLGTEGSQGKDRIAKTIYDILGRPTQMRRAVGTAKEQAEVTYSYTVNGQKQFVIDANGNKAELVYDGFDRLARWSFPSKTMPSAYNDATQATALSTSGAVSTTDYEQYSYDANGNRTSLRKRDGLTITYNYDAVNRMTSKIIPAKPGAAAVHTRNVYYDYDFRGLQTKARFDSLTGPGVDNAYDVLGRMTSSTNRMFSSPKTLTYNHDIAGRRTRITHPDGQYFTYSYDDSGRPLHIRENGSDYIRLGYYNDRGQMWRNIRRLTPRIQGHFVYDAIGRVKRLHTVLPGTASDNIFTFTYNPASQMASRTTSNDSYANSAHFDVDRSYSVNGLNQYTQVGPDAFTHDDNGNLTSDGSVTFLYDVENRLVGATGAKTAELTYDPMGRLWQIGSGAAAQQLLYDGDALVAEYNALGVISDRYVHDVGADTPLTWYTGSAVGASNRRHLMPNWQGSIAAIVDNDGNAININAYDSWGIPDAGNIGRFQYTGQMWIPELGLYHYKARTYSPALGRFLQTDPIGYEDQYNLYAYTGNDPINMVDPSGMVSCVQLKVCDGGGTIEGVTSNHSGDGGTFYSAEAARQEQLAGAQAKSKGSSKWTTPEAEQIYQSGVKRGDPYAKVGLEFGADKPSGMVGRSRFKLYQYLLLGEGGKVELWPGGKIVKGTKAQRARAFSRYRTIRTDLARAYVSAVAKDRSGKVGFLGIGQIYDIHKTVFTRHGIPMTFFGGTPFTGKKGEAYISAPIWCPKCVGN